MKLATFFAKFDQFADAPGAVAKMRELVLQLAVQGKLVEQRPKELSAKECIRKANKPLVDIVPDESTETPAGWAALQLGCLIASNTGGGTPSKQNPSYWNGSIPWASVKDVQSDKYLVATIDSITEEGLKDSSSNLIPPNRLIVVTRMGLGKLAINTISVAINQDLRAIEPTTALDLDFAYLLFKSLKMVGSGVTVKGITVDKLHAIPVVLPPLAEQKRIVAKVDELMALCDRLEAQQQERETRHAALARASLARFADAPTPANLPFLFHPSYAIPPADLRKSILTLAVQGKLVPQDPNDEPAASLLAQITRKKNAMIEAKTVRQGKVSRPHSALDAPSELPPGWEWVNVDSLCFKVTDGTHFTPQYAASGVRFVSAKDIVSGKLIFDRCKFITQEEHAQLYRRCNPDYQDIVISKSGSIGTVALVEDRGEFSLFESLALLKFDQTGLFPPFLVCALTHACASLTTGHIRGVGVKHLHLDILRGLEMALPPLAEQRRIVAKVEQLMALVDALETQLAASRATAANLLSALVAELTGTPRNGKASVPSVSTTGSRGRPRKS